ncbi:MAG: aldehyde dehydrogenase family protein [Myxococcales bacterium]
MSVAQKLAPTPRSDLDRVLQKVKEGSKAFAKLPIGERVALLEDIRARYASVMEDAVRAGCQAKGIDFDSQESSEEWLAHGFVVMRSLRLLVESLKDIQNVGAPRLPAGAVRRLENGRTAVRVFPASGIDGATFAGIQADVWMQPSVTPENLAEHQAVYYKKPDHDGKVALVLGAGNVPSIPALDVTTKMFNEGKACILKMNPVNEYVGPFIEKAFAQAIEKGYFAVVYGGAEEGAHLVNHELVDEVHITGSDKTHDLLVWGPPGPERAARMARNEPLLKKEIGSELGNVSPVVVVPGPWRDSELEYTGFNIAGMVTNNASFNCNAAKLLVQSKEWDGRERLLESVQKALAHAHPRKAYYPGAEERFKAFTDGRKNLKLVGEAKEGELPWALITDLDSSDREERCFTTEAWCAVLGETTLAEEDPIAFLEKAVDFVNDRVWGTLCVTLLIHGETMADPDFKRALDKAIQKLRYGTVAINLWPASVFAMGTTPWGAHPSSTLTDIQSGKGWVHNTYMLEEIEKVVISAPHKQFPKPLWFPGHKTAGTVARKVTDLENGPSWGKVASIALAAMRG